MTIEEIKALPIRDIADKDCTLFLWVTMPMLQEGLDVIKAWGFKYRTCAFVWVKQNPSNDYRHPSFFFPTDKEVFNIYSGIGHWTNGNAELCLFAKKGSPKRQAKNVKQIILAPRSRHSEKPAETRDRILQLLGDLPRVELFARTRTEGWDVFGNQVEDSIELKEVI